MLTTAFYIDFCGGQNNSRYKWFEYVFFILSPTNWLSDEWTHLKKSHETWDDGVLF